MNLELHLIQSFAPSNLNRDDTGSPKSADFGGYRRARISSQAIKRAMRTTFDKQGLLPPERLAVRTKRLRDQLAERLVAGDRSEELAKAVAEAALNAIGLKLADADKTQYLVYLGRDEVHALEQFCLEHWDALQSRAEPSPTGRRSRQTAEASAVPAAAVNALKQRLDGGRAADLALFGRMLAALPEQNRTAASQVAHALSTHQVNLDFDYYTAIDDLKPEDTAGADMIGTVEFNAACYYRYANIDLNQLRENLGDDEELWRATVRAFLQASRDAIPTGKQNSFAAQNLPAFALAVVRPGGFWSLANAFVEPVRPSDTAGLIQASVKRLVRHWADMVELYGEPGGEAVACALGSIDIPDPLGQVRVRSYDDLVQRVMTALGG